MQEVQQIDAAKLSTALIITGVPFGLSAPKPDAAHPSTRSVPNGHKGERYLRAGLINNQRLKAGGFRVDTRTESPDARRLNDASNEVRLVLCSELAKQPKYARQLKSNETAKMVKATAPDDIDKVSIPGQILLKPGKLSHDLWKIMRTHANLGAKQSAATLAKKRAPNIKMFLQIAIDFAGCHHENWDESGCPNALKGGEIPLPARLMALADMFDTLISRRGCEPAFSWDKTCAFLIQDKGKHFDPELLEIFITRKQEFLTIANRYKDLQA